MMTGRGGFDHDEYDDEEESRRTRKRSRHQNWGSLQHGGDKFDTFSSNTFNKRNDQKVVLNYKHKRHEMFKAFVMEQASIDAEIGREAQQ